MSISDKTRKMLWGRSGGVCSICKKQVFEDDTACDDPSVLGQECHIVGEKKSAGSPRGMNDLELSKRDVFGNLILLCLDHHKIIDDQVDKYSVEKLHEIKNEHLVWVRSNLKLDESKQQDDEIYLGFAEKLADLAGFSDWDNFTYRLLDGDAPRVDQGRLEKIEQMQDWLFNRVYPGRYPELDRAFENFRRVFHDFRSVFSRHLDPDSKRGACVTTPKFYKRDHSDHELFRQYDEHCRLLSDYALELTRAGNYLCDLVRKHVYRHYRLNDGMLLARLGMDMTGSQRTVRLSYREEDMSDYPYPGLEAFMTERVNRDFAYGPENDGDA